MFFRTRSIGFLIPTIVLFYSIAHCPTAKGELVGSEDVDTPVEIDIEEEPDANTTRTRSRRRRVRRSRGRTTFPSSSTSVSRRSSSDERPWWTPETYSNSIGYEAPAPGSGSALGSQGVHYGTWFSPKVGLDFFLGFVKQASTFTTDRTDVFDENAKTRTVTLINSGVNVGSNIFVGAHLKFALFRNEWALIYFGPSVAFSPGSSSDTPTGTRVETTPDTDDADDFSVTQTAFGNINTARGSLISVGPKIGGEFYPKWIPHVAIGIAAGIVGVIGGDVTTTTTTSNSSFLVVDGVPQDPATPPPVTSQTITVDRGLEGSTFAIANTGFNLFSVFTIRFVW